MILKRGTQLKNEVMAERECLVIQPWPHHVMVTNVTARDIHDSHQYKQRLEEVKAMQVKQTCGHKLSMNEIITY